MIMAVTSWPKLHGSGRTGRGRIFWAPSTQKLLPHARRVLMLSGSWSVTWSMRASTGLSRHQILEREGRLPARIVACVGGGSNALGIFTAFLEDPEVELIGVEAGGEGLDSGDGPAGRPPRHGAPLTVGGRAGVLHGALSAVMQDEEGQIVEAHSISAGLDYPGTGPQHAFLRDSGRARYEAVTDRDALAAFREVSRLEGIVPALETAHALAWVLAQSEGDLDLVCLSGRGDKDLAEVLAQ